MFRSVLALSLVLFVLSASAPGQEIPETEPVLKLTKEEPAGWFRKKKRRSKASNTSVIQLPAPVIGKKTGINHARRQAESIARMKLPYRFGGCNPSDGGMDCSGSIQYLLKSLGYLDAPRTSYAQYDWVKKHSRVKRDKELDARKLKPGDLIFWGGTYDSGHKVSHVMMYMGEGTNGKLYMYGARGTNKVGISGAGVDIFELRSGKHNSLVGYGRIPASRF